MVNAEFYKILYQNETLFSSREEEVNTQSVEPAIEIPAVKQETPVIQPEVISKSCKILVLVDNPKKEELDASEGVFLYKVLKSVGYDSEDTDILNVGYVQGQELQEALLTRKAHYVISFGVPYRKISLDLLLSPYEPTTIDGICFLLVDPLSVVEADVNIKKRLWGALKVMFAVV